MINPRIRALENQKSKNRKKLSKYGIKEESLADKNLYPFFSERSKNDFYQNK